MGIRLGGSSSIDISIHPSMGVSSCTAKPSCCNKTEHHKPPKPRLILLAKDLPPAATEGLWLTVNHGQCMGQLSLLLGRVQGLFCFPCGHCQQWKCQCQEWCHLQQTGASITVSLPTGEHRPCQKYISHCSIQRPYASHPRLTPNGKTSLISFSRSLRTPKIMRYSKQTLSCHLHQVPVPRQQRFSLPPG